MDENGKYARTERLRAYFKADPENVLVNRDLLEASEALAALLTVADGTDELGRPRRSARKLPAKLSLHLGRIRRALAVEVEALETLRVETLKRHAVIGPDGRRKAWKTGEEDGKPVGLEPYNDEWQEVLDDTTTVRFQPVPLAEVEAALANGKDGEAETAALEIEPLVYAGILTVADA